MKSGTRKWRSEVQPNADLLKVLLQEERDKITMEEKCVRIAKIPRRKTLANSDGRAIRIALRQCTLRYVHFVVATSDRYPRALARRTDEQLLHINVELL